MTSTQTEQPVNGTPAVQPPLKLQRGMLLQLNTWLKDVWSEILHVEWDELPNPSVRFIRYDTMGNKRWIETAGVDDIRATKDSVFLTEKERRSGSIHLSLGRFGSNVRGWDVPILSTPTRSTPQVFAQVGSYVRAWEMWHAMPQAQTSQQPKEKKSPKRIRKPTASPKTIAS